MHLVAAPDKFKGTISAPSAARALAAGARRAGWTATECPLADGGEGTLDAFGGPNRTDEVTGPLGKSVEAAWRLDGERAVIEMAQASGLVVAGGRARNDPVLASTRGTGELIDLAIRSGAHRIIVGVGGSATTDGGAGAIEALNGKTFRELGVVVDVACDVETTFLDAPRVFGPQKGADDRLIDVLTNRLIDLVKRYQDDYGVDVQDVAHGGAAGGLAGGLFALGANLEGGFEVIASAVDFEHIISGADLVVSGEGRLDETSFAGKVVGGVRKIATPLGISMMVVAGEVDRGARDVVPAISLVEQFGVGKAMRDTERCLEEAVFQWLDGREATEHPGLS